MKVVVPHASECDLSQMIKEVAECGNLVPFGDVAIEFAATLSSELLTRDEFKPFPELRALGFWMRRSELLKQQKQFQSMTDGDCLLVPRGLVFHVPPSNVDTLFVYSWLIALVTGNRNIVRLSTRTSAAGELLCQLVSELLAFDEFAVIRRGTRFVSYGHDVDVTRAISEAADVRVLWGGDTSIESLRSVPIAAWAKEITFPDRWSLAAIDTMAWSNLDDTEKQAVAEQFFNDSFWFDQLACSSARQVLFCGQPDRYRDVSDDFFGRVADVAETRGFRWPTSALLDRTLYAHQAVLDRGVTEVHSFGCELTVLHMPDLGTGERWHPGGGVFFSASCEHLADLIPHVNRRDQTLSVFGFEHDELMDLARSLNGRGIDRIVPIGQALQFHRYWDGYDLWREFTRVCHVPGWTE